MTTGDLDHDRLLAEARRLLSSDAMVLVGRRERASALLCRGSIEELLNWFWTSSEPSMTGTTMRAQLLCLAEYVGATAAGSAAYLYGALSDACHYHLYDLPPTTSELSSWMDSIGALAETISAVPRAATHA